MAEYLTNDTDLTAVANAIRTKGGTSAALTFPAGFVSAIEAIPTGGGGTSDFEVHPVTITSTNNTYICAPFISTYPPDILATNPYINRDTPTTINFVFYKGRCYTEFDDMWVLSGAAAFDDEYYRWYFTGEGSVSMEPD